MNTFVHVKKPILLSTLWIFVMLNMIFADIVGFISPGFDAQIAEMHPILTPQVLLAFAVLLEVPIAMVLLSHILNDRALRWAHAVAVPLTILFVVGGGSLSPHYFFFATMEIVAMLTALYIAWGVSPEMASEPHMEMVR